MKKIGYFLILFVVIGCSAQRYLEKGKYNKAFEKAVKKLQRKPESVEEIKVLKKAYPKLKKEDKERIQYLRKLNRSDRWYKILSRYRNLKERQELLETVLPLYIEGEKITFEHYNYNEKILQTKQNAAEYYYEEGKALMNKQNKEAYRKAYKKFQNVMDFVSNYKDVNDKLKSAKDLGKSLTLITVANNTNRKFSDKLYKRLLSFGTSAFNEQWVEFIIKTQRDDFDYDYIISANILDIDVGAGKISEETSTKEKKIRSGWEYVLDEDGNVKKDSLGNDIKKPDYKTISCKVTETNQHKEAEIEGYMEITDNRTGQVLAKKSIEGKSVFDYTFYSADGNLKALSDDLKEKLEYSEKPFPDDEQLIYSAAEIFAEEFEDKIRWNTRYIK